MALTRGSEVMNSIGSGRGRSHDALAQQQAPRAFFFFFYYYY